MPTAIRMPDLGTAVNEVKILKWIVPEGASVTRGAMLVEIETDKAVTELESVAEGTVLKHCVPEGASVKSGEIIAYVGVPGEAIQERPVVATVVANLAAKLGVDLAAVKGTGESGRITREDVLRAGRTAEPVAAPEVEQLSKSQAAVARAVEKSNAEIPHLRVAASIDMTAVRQVRAQAAYAGSKAFYEAVFLKAMARAIEAVPLIAARLDGQRIVRPQGIHISVAVGFGAELSLPVVRDVDRKDLVALAAEVEALAARAKAGALRLEDITGGVIALSNLGMYPLDWFEAVVFPGQSAILAVGAVSSCVVAVDDRVEVRPMVTVTVAADHRLINGRVAAEYLAKVKEVIESGAFA